MQGYLFVFSFGGWVSLLFLNHIISSHALICSMSWFHITHQSSDEFRRPIQVILHKNDDQLEAYKMNGSNF